MDRYDRPARRPLRALSTILLLAALAPAGHADDGAGIVEDSFEDVRGTTVHRDFLPHPDDPEKKVELFWVAPSGDGPWPAILYVHGHQFPERPGAGVYVETPVLQRMARRGLLAAAVSQPGYGKSDGPPDFCGPYTHRAIHTALARLRSRPESDGRVVLYGYSRGAIASSMVATEDAGLAGLVLGGGIYDLGDAHRRLVEHPEGKDSGLLANLVNETGGAGEEALAARSALPRAAKIKAPTLILHGEDDGISPVDHAERLAAALEAAGTDVELVTFPGVDHHIPFEARNENLYRFLDKVLKRR